MPINFSLISTWNKPFAVFPSWHGVCRCSSISSVIHVFWGYRLASQPRIISEELFILRILRKPAINLKKECPGRSTPLLIVHCARGKLFFAGPVCTVPTTALVRENTSCRVVRINGNRFCKTTRQDGTLCKKSNCKSWRLDICLLHCISN